MRLGPTSDCCVSHPQHCRDAGGHTPALKVSQDSPNTVLGVDVFLQNVGRPPVGLQLVGLRPELDEKVGDLARWRQQALQVERVIAGEAEAPRGDDGRTEF